MTIEATLEQALNEKQASLEQQEKAVSMAVQDYQQDAELTAFTAIDGDPLYDY